MATDSGDSRRPEDCSPHGWTLDTLEEHLTSKTDGIEKYFTDLSNECEAASKA
jgi:hypothetical protein